MIPNWGARVLIYGFAGVGKDALTAALVREDCIGLQPGFKLQAWIQGSTNNLFEEQLRKVCV